MINLLPPVRTEVMKHLEGFVDTITEKYLKKPEDMWQPSDWLPDTRNLDAFVEKVKEIQESAKELAYDVWAVLIADTITEEALPTYESWIMALADVDLASENGWGGWTRKWTAEENRHGDLLNKYLYLSGRVDMRQFEISTQYLISDGMDIQTNGDPYRTFVYTSFQEIATQISHRRVGTLAKQAGNKDLAKMCGMIAADEGRHARAYMSFVDKIFEVDPSEMMLALADMMKKKIVMPAHNLREMGLNIGDSFLHFSNAAQRLNIYTSQDYVDIMSKLLKDWKIDQITDLTGEAERARDYLMKLPGRMQRVLGRVTIPEIEYEYKWILPA
ncbi:MAG: acyl-[acyl-carrier-protein] desaturase [Cognaticolwellia sp.]|jgi:acyl-[acyl-carrier-protein] desaturase